MNERLSARERIRRKSDFTRLYSSGSRFRGRYFSLVYSRNEFGYSRLAVVVSRKVGHAVTRNRVKRLLRAVFRRNKALFQEPLDLIVVARPDIATLKAADLKDGFCSAIEAIFRQRISL